jgi:hypothetical protein
MFLELIGVIMAAAVAGITFFAINRLLGGALPRWLMPVCAGLAMIAATISLEYSWFTRTSGNLPEGLVVADKIEDQAIYRPWTYLNPYVGRFSAVDTANATRNDAMPGHVMADVYFFGRWSPVNRVPVLFDCVGARRASLADGAEFDDAGRVVNATWHDMIADDPVLITACEE